MVKTSYATHRVRKVQFYSKMFIEKKNWQPGRVSRTIDRRTDRKGTERYINVQTDKWTCEWLSGCVDGQTDEYIGWLKTDLSFAIVNIAKKIAIIFEQINITTTLRRIISGIFFYTYTLYWLYLEHSILRADFYYSIYGLTLWSHSIICSK